MANNAKPGITKVVHSLYLCTKNVRFTVHYVQSGRIYNIKAGIMFII